MKNLTILFILSITVIGCATEDLLLKQYGHPSAFRSAEEWMANSYLKGAYVNGKAIYYTVTGLSNEVFTTRESALSRMKNAYPSDYRKFFVECFKQYEEGLTCDYLK